LIPHWRIARSPTPAPEKLKESAKDSVSFPFWRLLVGQAPPDSVEEAMYEAEVAQVVLRQHTACRVAGGRG
jgi:hypothetical protein